MAAALVPGGREVVLAGTDHALYCVDLLSARVTRRLYAARHGHAEWVTCVAALTDGSGRVVSGGMDSKVCVWSSRGVGAVELLGHSASVSDVRVAGALVASASYDKSVRLWDATGAALAALQEHSAPVLCLSLAAGEEGSALRLASGDRGGELVTASVGTALRRERRVRAHEGHVTAVAHAPEGVVSGG